MDDPYAILGITKHATIEEIKTAYKAWLKIYHPDKHDKEKDPEVVKIATEMTRKLKEAYDALIGEKEKPGKSDGNGKNSGLGLSAKLALLHSTAKSGGRYIIELSADESITPQLLWFEGRSDITIMLRGAGANRVVSLSSDGAMFTVGEGVTLVLDKILP